MIFTNKMFYLSRFDVWRQIYVPFEHTSHMCGIISACFIWYLNGTNLFKPAVSLSLSLFLSVRARVSHIITRGRAAVTRSDRNYLVGNRFPIFRAGAPVSSRTPGDWLRQQGLVLSVKGGSDYDVSAFVLPAPLNRRAHAFLRERALRASDWCNARPRQSALCSNNGDTKTCC